jgi:hypothetical protein
MRTGDRTSKSPWYRRTGTGEGPDPEGYRPQGRGAPEAKTAAEIAERLIKQRGQIEAAILKAGDFEAGGRLC